MTTLKERAREIAQSVSKAFSLDEYASASIELSLLAFGREVLEMEISPEEHTAGWNAHSNSRSIATAYSAMSAVRAKDLE